MASAAEQATARRNRYVEDHLALVEVIARSMLRRMLPSIEYDDLYQQGCLGLIDAAARYKRSYNVPFVLYAKWRIRGAILDSVRRRHARNAAHLPLTPDVYERPGAGADQLERTVELRELQAIIARSKEALTPEEQAVLTLYYDRDAKLKGVGLAFGVKQSQSSTIVRSARQSLARELYFRGVTRRAA